jgi:predicted amidohydrolase
MTDDHAPPTYSALALQLATDCVNGCPDRESAREMMRASLARIGPVLRTSVMFVKQYSGLDVKLVVLPEYVLTGFPMGEDVATWADKAAIEPDGPEYESLARMASDAGVFLAGNAYETDAHFPGLFFQCCFLLSPAGETLLRYRRMISLSSPTPYDVWDRYLELYGAESLFPVADTEIGRIGAVASEEILYPEIARMMVLRGAEVLVHPTSENGSPILTNKEIARRARAMENMAYVVSANSASLEKIPFPPNSTAGMSKVIDYYGNVLMEAAPGGDSMVANAPIDLHALRAARRRAGMTNMLSRLPLQAFAESFATIVNRPANRLLRSGEVAVPARGELPGWQREDIAKLIERGVL